MRLGHTAVGAYQAFCAAPVRLASQSELDKVTRQTRPGYVCARAGTSSAACRQSPTKQHIQIYKRKSSERGAVVHVNIITTSEFAGGLGGGRNRSHDYNVEVSDALRYKLLHVQKTRSNAHHDMRALMHTAAGTIKEGTRTDTGGRSDSMNVECTLV
jgi:hypothetical protein